MVHLFTFWSLLHSLTYSLALNMTLWKKKNGEHSECSFFFFFFYLIKGAEGEQSKICAYIGHGENTLIVRYTPKDLL